MNKLATVFFPSSHIQIYKNIADAQGLDLQAELAIDSALLEDILSGKALIGGEVMLKLLDFAERHSPEGYPPGLYILKNLNLTDLGVAGLALTLSQNLEQVFSLLLRTQALLIPAVSISRLDQANQICAEFSLDPAFESHRRTLIESTLGAFFLVRNYLEQPEVTAVEVTFALDELYDKAHYEAFFGCPVLFNQPHDRTAIDKETAQQPLKTANSTLRSQLIEELLSNPSHINGVNTQVRHLVKDALKNGFSMSLEQAADKLNMSQRSISRRLREENSNFRAIYNEEVIYYSKRLLKNNNLSAKVIASRLGFSSTAAFTRSFKAITGKTPTEFRRKQ